MPAPRKHPHAEEIRRLLEQLARWGGNARTWRHTCSPLAWIGDYMRRGDFHGPTIPLLSGEAADTASALTRMPLHLRQALETHYTASGSEDEQIKILNRMKRSSARISARTYRLHVELAHDSFWEHYTAIRDAAHRAEAGNQRLSPAAAAEGAIAAPRERPQNTPWREVGGDKVRAETVEFSD